MMHYSVQARDKIFVTGSRILSSAKNMGKNICKNIRKNKIIKKFLVKVNTEAVNTTKNFFIMINNLQQMHLSLICLQGGSVNFTPVGFPLVTQKP